MTEATMTIEYGENGDLILYDENGNIVAEEFASNTPATKEKGEVTWKEESDVIGIVDFFALWPTEEAALEWYENHRWRNGLFCPRCGGDNAYRVKSGKPLSHRCRDCKKYFSVKIGTPMENSNLSVRKFLLYIHLLLNDRKGESALKMHKSISTARRTSWFTGHRIRRMMTDTELPLLEGTVQVDEAFFGGKFGNMHTSKKKKLSNWMANKIPVIGLRDENGKVVVKQLPDTDADTLLDFVLTHVKPGSTVWSDGQPAYQQLPRLWLRARIREPRRKAIRERRRRNH